MNHRNEMEVKERSEHILALKVMRLTRPTLCSPLVVTCDAKDLPGNLLNNDLKHDVTSVSGVETLAAGQFLLLPQSFGIIYLGETFSSYICVHNDSNQIATDVTVKVDLQTTSQRISLSGQHPQTRKELRPQETVDDVIHHEVKEVGTHILLCEVSYNCPQRSNLSFRKFFKFEVFKPLDVKTKFYNAEDFISDEVYLEAQVQNITSGPICLEKVSLEASETFTVTALNTTAEGESVFGKVNVLQPQTSRQFLYCLAPLVSDLGKLSEATNVGKLDIVWRSNLGERGRLQTSQLQRMAPDYGDIRLSVQELPNVVRLEETFRVVCRVVNTCDKSMDLVLGLESPSGLVWSQVSGRHLGKLDPGASLQLVLDLVPLAAGLQIISGIRLTDVILKRTYDYDELAQVFVVHN